MPKLHSQTKTTVTNGAYYYTIIPDGLGGWIDRQISYQDLMNDVVSGLNDLRDQQGNISIIRKSTAADYIQTLPVNVKLESIDFRATSGSPVIKVGSTSGGEEYIQEKSIVIGTDDNNFIGQSFNAAQSLYISVSGGTVSITLSLRTNILT